MYVKFQSLIILNTIHWYMHVLFGLSVLVNYVHLSQRCGKILQTVQKGTFPNYSGIPLLRSPTGHENLAVLSG